MLLLAIPVATLIALFTPTRPRTAFLLAAVCGTIQMIVIVVLTWALYIPFIYIVAGFNQS